MTTCKTKNCPHRVLPQPGALFCDECQKRALDDIEAKRRDPAIILRLRDDDAVWRRAGLPPPPYPPVAGGWWDGPPNVTCPACAGRYHYSGPVTCSHLCPFCETWLCWQETQETEETKQRVARLCLVCGKQLQKKRSSYGPWWGCTWIRKGHKDNCPGERKWADCDIAVEERPRLGLVVWRPHVRDDSDDVDHFGQLDRATQKRKTAIEARAAARYTRWWERGPGLGEE